MEGNELWERLKIHTIQLVRFMGNGTKGLLKMNVEIQAQHEGVSFPTEVKWLSNRWTIKTREQR